MEKSDLQVYGAVTAAIVVAMVTALMVLGFQATQIEKRRSSPERAPPTEARAN